MDSVAYRNPTININQNVGNVTNSYQNVWNNCEITVSDERRQILDWLSPLVPRERHQALRESRMDGVGRWLLRTSEFEKWHTSEDRSVNPVLFCHGDPGVGKTYLSSLVIDTLCDGIGGDNVAVACFYVDYGNKEQSATGVLAALLRQLVAGAESIQEEIREAFERAKKAVDGRGLRLAEIQTMLVKSISSLRRGFLCIDGLDEFPTKYRPEIWGCLQYIVRECPNVRLFITGRPYIREEVGKYFSGYPDLPPLKATEEDMQEYLTMRLSNDPELDAMDTELEADILRIIPKKVSGAFLLASLTIEAVLQDVTIHQRRQTLHERTKGSGLDDAYNATLDRIRGQGGSKSELGMGVLMWLLHSESPLNAEELCYAMGIEVGATDMNLHNVPSKGALMRSTLGLVTIDKHASTVRLVHFTLHEYLASHPGLFTTPHSMIAEVCLTYLNFRSFCEPSTPLATIPSTTPLLNYASCNWGFHARKETTESVKRLALRLLDGYDHHISAQLLLVKEIVGFLPRGDRYRGIQPDLRGFTGLHCAAYFGIAEIGSAMVDMQRWHLDARDSNGATPLIWASKHGNYAFAKLLLEQEDVDPTLSDKQGLSALTHAARARHQGIVKLLLERRDVNPDWPDEHGRTPLSHAADSGSVSVVRILLERVNVSPDSLDADGRTSLSYAAESANEDVVKLLLERGDVSPDLSDSRGRTPLSYAAGSGNEGVVKILMHQTDINPDSTDEDGRTPLSYATGSGNGGVVKLLMQRIDVTLDSADGDGRTPLSYAAESGRAGTVKLLLERNDVNPDLSNKYGRTALSYAAESGRVGVVKILMQRTDINPDSADEDGRTPLSYASGSGREGVVELLIERRNVSTDLPDRCGRTPLSYAAGFGHAGMVKMFLQRIDVTTDLPDKCGRTPLSYAAGSGHEGVVQILLQILLQMGGVNPYLLDKYSQTPLTRAAGLGSAGIRVVKLLSEPGTLSHETSQDSDVLQKLPPMALREAESGPVLRPGDIVHYMRDEITEAIPPSDPDKPPLNQPNVTSTAFILYPAPMPPAALHLRSLIRVEVPVGASCLCFLCLMVLFFLYFSPFSSLAMLISVRQSTGEDLLYYCSIRGGCKLV